MRLRDVSLIEIVGATRSSSFRKQKARTNCSFGQKNFNHNVERSVVDPQTRYTAADIFEITVIQEGEFNI